MPFTCSFDTTSLPSAQKNMDYDVHLLHDLSPNSRCIRLYSWKNPGITYSYKQAIPSNLRAIDHGQRVTGGGIVFHSPGDIVLSCSFWLDDPAFPKPLKSKLSLLSTLIQSASNTCGIALTTTDTTTIDDTTFCQSYPNPYELYYESQKVVAFTLRRYKDRCIVHIEIHTSPTHPIFREFSDYSPFFSEGFPIDCAPFNQALRHGFEEL